MTTEYGIQRLIPSWSTNPDLPAGQPYPKGDDRRNHADRLLIPYPTRAAAERTTQGWEPGTWRVLVREVTDWEPA